MLASTFVPRESCFRAVAALSGSAQLTVGKDDDEPLALPAGRRSLRVGCGSMAGG